MKIARRTILKAVALLAPFAASVAQAGEAAPIEEIAVKSVEKPEPTSLDYFHTKEHWDRAIGWGTVPPERDYNNPDNAEIIAKLKAKQQNSFNI